MQKHEKARENNPYKNSDVKTNNIN